MVKAVEYYENGAIKRIEKWGGPVWGQGWGTNGVQYSIDNGTNGVLDAVKFTNVEYHTAVRSITASSAEGEGAVSVPVHVIKDPEAD